MRQIGPWPAEPLAATLEWRIKELDARLRVVESLLAATQACPGCHRGDRPGLTAEQAREMAAALLAQAAALDDQASCDPSESRNGSPSQAAAPSGQRG